MDGRLAIHTGSVVGAAGLLHANLELAEQLVDLGLEVDLVLLPAPGRRFLDILARGPFDGSSPSLLGGQVLLVLRLGRFALAGRGRAGFAPLSREYLAVGAVVVFVVFAPAG